MEKNDNFLKEISDLGLSKDSTLIFICRSGARSRSAAEFLTNHGYKHCFNFCEGFEGSHDELDIEVMSMVGMIIQNFLGNKDKPSG